MDLKTYLADEPAALSNLDRTPIRELVAQKIATLIASGVISTGDVLPSERDLATAMSVSRETIRGALLILSTHGILSVTQGARTTVVSDQVSHIVKEIAQYPTSADYTLKEVHEARLLVEEHLVRAAADRIDDHTLGLLRSMIGAQESSMDDPIRFLISDREFHTTIYRAGNNSPLAVVASNLYSYLLDHRRRIVAKPGSIAISIEDHKAILAGLESRDPDQAASAFATHEARIYETTQRLLGSILT